MPDTTKTADQHNRDHGAIWRCSLCGKPARAFYTMSKVRFIYQHVDGSTCDSNPPKPDPRKCP